MSILDYLEASHKRQRRALHRCENDPVAFEEFRSELLKHVNDEETLLFPCLLAIDVLSKTVKHAWGEHAEIFLHMQKLDSLPRGSTEWSKAFGHMKALHLNHLDEEEKNLFPMIRKFVTQPVLIDLLANIKSTGSKEALLYPAFAGEHTSP